MISSYQKEGNNPSVNVLLVEDDLLNQLVVTQIIKQWGFMVTIANHGKEALKLIKTKCFALILMDIGMPEMDGCETTQQIRLLDDPYFKTIPIIAFTASVDANTKEKAELLGMNDVIRKPFNTTEMFDKINYYLKNLTPTILPLKINFELYANSTPQFKLDLLALMTTNIQELQGALQNRRFTQDGLVFCTAAHKVKATLILLDDTEFMQAVEEMKKHVYSKDKALLERKAAALNERCNSILQHVNMEAEMVKESLLNT